MFTHTGGQMRQAPGYGKKKPTKFTGPLLPRSYEQAAAWLGKRAKLVIGFVHSLVRNEAGAIEVRETGKRAPVSLYVNPRPRF
jgi:hypothetical protein